MKPHVVATDFVLTIADFAHGTKRRETAQAFLWRKARRAWIGACRRPIAGVRRRLL